MDIKNLVWQKALEHNQRVIDKHPGVMHSPKPFLKSHLPGVFDIAYETARKIDENNTYLGLNVLEILYGAGLHDIGRPLSSNPVLGQLGHEIRSGIWIDEHFAAEENYGANPRRVAQMARSHASMFEQWQVAFDVDIDRGHALAEEFGNYNPHLLVPRTWQEAIVTYADLCDGGGKRVDPFQKLVGAMQRYSTDPKFKDKIVVEGHKKAMTRLAGLCEFVDIAQKETLDPRKARGWFGVMS